MTEEAKFLPGELEAANECPAVMVNRTVLEVKNYICRLTFLEADSTNKVIPRCAVAISLPDMVSLHQLLGSMITQLSGGGQLPKDKQH